MPVEDYPVLDAVSISAEPGNAPAPENINCRVLKEVADEIAPILALIYQLSLDAVKVPSDWKAANVSPIFKKSEQYYPANYRPVTLASVLKLCTMVWKSRLLLLLIVVIFPFEDFFKPHFLEGSSKLVYLSNAVGI